MKERRAKLTLVGLSLLVSFGLAEGLSAYVMGQVGQSPLMYTASPYTSFTLLPGVEAPHFSREFQVTYRVNADGYRGAPVPRPKPAGVRHVLFLGDSFAFGHGVEEDEMVSERLERRFRDAGEAVEVVNGGFMAGTSPDDALSFLRSPRADALAPDGVVELVFLKNDMRDMTEHEWTKTSTDGLPLEIENPTGGPNALHGRGPVPFYKSWPILRSLNTAQLLGRVYFAFVQLPQRSERLKAWAEDYLATHDGLSARFVSVIRGLSAETRRRRIPLLVAIIPTSKQTHGEPHPLYDRARDRLVALLEAEGIPHVVLGPDIIAPDDLYPLDSHWTATGHDKAAAAIHAAWPATAAR